MYGLGANGPYPALFPLHTGGYDGAGGHSTFEPFGDDDPALPYLMGFPPPGVTFAKAQPLELLYTRELTAEEKKARELYFGKAPKEASRGLPKYDGRDFYLPSPTKKERVEPAEAPLSNNSNIGCPGTNSGIWPPPAGKLETTYSSSNRNPSIGAAKVKASIERVSSRSSYRSDERSTQISGILNTNNTPKKTTEKEDGVISLDSWNLPKNQAFSSPVHLERKSSAARLHAQSPFGLQT